MHLSSINITTQSLSLRVLHIIEFAGVQARHGASVEHVPRLHIFCTDVWRRVEHVPQLE
jgi:hypothetical protein